MDRAVTQRLDRVDQENRLLKWAGVLALTRAVLVGLVSLAEAQDVEQHKRRSMTGIPGVYVLVESLTPEIEQGGLHTSRRQRVTGLLVKWEQLSRFHLPFYLFQGNRAEVAAVLPHPSAIPEDIVGALGDGIGTEIRVCFADGVRLVQPVAIYVDISRSNQYGLPGESDNALRV